MTAPMFDFTSDKQRRSTEKMIEEFMNGRGTDNPGIQERLDVIAVRASTLDIPTAARVHHAAVTAVAGMFSVVWYFDYQWAAVGALAAALDMLPEPGQE